MAEFNIATKDLQNAMINEIHALRDDVLRISKGGKDKSFAYEANTPHVTLNPIDGILSINKFETVIDRSESSQTFANSPSYDPGVQTIEMNIPANAFKFQGYYLITELRIGRYTLTGGYETFPSPSRAAASGTVRARLINGGSTVAQRDITIAARTSPRTNITEAFITINDTPIIIDTRLGVKIQMELEVPSGQTAEFNPCSISGYYNASASHLNSSLIDTDLISGPFLLTKMRGYITSDSNDDLILTRIVTPSTILGWRGVEYAGKGVTCNIYDAITGDLLLANCPSGKDTIQSISSTEHPSLKIEFIVNTNVAPPRDVSALPVNYLKSPSITWDAPDTDYWNRSFFTTSPGSTGSAVVLEIEGSGHLMGLFATGTSTVTAHVEADGVPVGSFDLFLSSSYNRYTNVSGLYIRFENHLKVTANSTSMVAYGLLD